MTSKKTKYTSPSRRAYTGDTRQHPSTPSISDAMKEALHHSRHAGTLFANKTFRSLIVKTCTGAILGEIRPGLYQFMSQVNPEDIPSDMLKKHDIPPGQDWTLEELTELAKDIIVSAQSQRNTAFHLFYKGDIKIFTNIATMVSKYGDAGELTEIFFGNIEDIVDEWRSSSSRSWFYFVSKAMMEPHVVLPEWNVCRPVFAIDPIGMRIRHFEEYPALN